MRHSRVKRVSMALFAVLGAAAVVLVAGVARAADPVPTMPFWDKGADWLTLRGGYVKSTAATAPNANVGAGVSYSRMVSSRFSIGATLDVDFLGKVGAASQLEIPVGVEYLWHAQWKSAGIHPYAGIGFAGYYMTVRRSGDDYTSFQPGGFLRTGLDLPIDGNTLMGVDIKIASVSADYRGDNPVFGPSEPSSGRVAVKLTYTRLLFSY